MSEMEDSSTSKIEDGLKLKIKVLESSIYSCREQSEHEYKCCWTCKHLRMEGVCKVYNREVPKNFMFEHEKCKSWQSEDIPF
jgi:hypothetical protein